MEQKLVLSREVLKTVQSDVAGRYPAEAYGFLVGRGGMGRRIVEQVIHGRDEPAGPGGGFMIPPAEMARAEQRARKERLDLVGVYHSAPDREATPTAAANLVLWEGYSYLLVPVVEGQVGAPRSYEKYENEFDEETVEITD